MHRAALLLGAQLLLAGSVAAKYALDRATLPRVWVPTSPVDPEQPLRGRYLALRIFVDGCALAGPQSTTDWDGPHQGRLHEVAGWQGVLVAEHGNLLARNGESIRPAAALEFLLPRGNDCHSTALREPLNYFIPEHAGIPSPKPGEALWVEVTVPTIGTPRPIQLALSDRAGFHPIQLR